MKGFIKQSAAALAAAVFLSGCGDDMMAMTSEEEAVVVNYSAGIVGKYNKYKADGLVFVKQEQEDQEEEQQEGEGGQEQDTKTEGGQGTDKGQGTAGANGPGEGSQGTGGEPMPQVTSSLNGLLGIPGLEFTYQNYEVMDEYKEGGYLSMEAPDGKTFLVLHVNITNGGQGAAACDVLGTKPMFTLKLNDSSGVKNEVTVHPNDLSTFNSTVEPGSTVGTLLFFVIPREQSGQIASIQLAMQKGGAGGQEVKLQ